MPPSVASALKQFSLVNHLPLSMLNLLAEHAEIMDYKRREVIYERGECTTELYLLLEGSVKQGIHHDDGREIITQILKSPDLFGESGIVNRKRRSQFATAMGGGARCVVVPVAIFKEVMRQDQALTWRVFEKIGQELHRAENRLEALIFKDARTRIIDFLKDSADRHGVPIGLETLVRHSLTQQDIANITGTSRQTVTSVLNELRKDNLIYFDRRRILIRDCAKLA